MHEKELLDLVGKLALLLQHAQYGGEKSLVAILAAPAPAGIGGSIQA